MSAYARHIRLGLAREPGHPQGDARTGYDIIAFLDEEGRLDPEACRARSARCRVRRFARNATVATGQLLHTPGDGWILDFPGSDRQDATGFRLGDERFVAGEYVSIIAADGAVHTYLVERIAEV